MKHLALTGGSDTILMRTASVIGTFVRDNALGVDPSGTAAVPSAANVLLGANTATTCAGSAGTTGVIDHNLMRASSSAVALCNLTGAAVGDWLIQHNIVRQSGAAAILLCRWPSQGDTALPGLPRR